MRVRFAPSPTGQLHVGNARTALFNWLLARGSGGTFILRIEDTDAERSTRESEAAILRDLRWLGLDWDEGPDVGGARGPVPAVRAAAPLRVVREGAARARTRRTTASARREQLEAERQAALADGPAGALRGHVPAAVAASRREARIAAGERPAIRFRVPEDREVVFADAVRGDVRFHTDVIGDPVIVRADGTPAYNFAVVIDDALMDDHACDSRRGSHLEHAAADSAVRGARVHAADLRAPGAGAGAGSQPLSKRHGATSVAEFRAKGYLPEALVNYLALIGWSPGGRRRAAAGRRAGAAVLARRRRPQRRRVRRREAGVGEPALPEDGGSGAARRAVAAVLRARRRGDGARRAGPRVSGVGDADRHRRRSIGSIRCRRGSRSCSTTTPEAALGDARSPSEMRGGRRARRRRARSPRSWRRRRGSIASGSARSRIR